MIDPLQTHLPKASAAIDPPQKPHQSSAKAAAILCKSHCCDRSSAKAIAAIDPLQKPLPRSSILCKAAIDQEAIAATIIVTDSHSHQKQKQIQWQRFPSYKFVWTNL